MDTEREDVLPFGKLEALAGALLTVLLSLMCASIARKQSEPLQLPAEFGIKFNQCAGNTEAGCAGLSADPAAMGEDQDVESISQLGSEQRLAHIGARRLVCKVVFKRPVIDRDLTLAGPQEDTRSRGLAASRC